MNAVNGQLTSNVKRNRYHWLRLGVFIIIGLITPFAICYMNYYDKNISRQENRVFRTLKELEKSIDQTISNLPFIHKIGLFRGVTKLDNEIVIFDSKIEYLNKEKESLEKEIKKLDKQIKFLDNEGIKVDAFIENQRRSRNEVVIEIENKRIKDKKNKITLKKLYENRDTKEKRLQEKQFGIESANRLLASNFFQQQENVNEIKKDINDSLFMLDMCKSQLSNNKVKLSAITQPSDFSINQINLFKEKLVPIRQVSNNILNILEQPFCKILSNEYKDNLSEGIHGINKQVNRIITKIENSKYNLSTDANSLIGESSIDTLIKDYENQKGFLEDCNAKGIEIENNNLVNFFSSLKNQNGLKYLRAINGSSENINISLFTPTLDKIQNTIIPLQSNKKYLQNIKSVCGGTISTDFSTLIDESIKHYTAYITFLEELDTRLNSINNDIDNTNKLRDSYNRSDKKIRELLNANAGSDFFAELESYDRRITKHIEKTNDVLRDKKNKTKRKEIVQNKLKKISGKILSFKDDRNKVVKKKAISNLKENELKKNLEIIKQTPGFEHIDKITNRHIEVSCNTSANDIISVIRPLNNSSQMEIITYEPMTGGHINKSIKSDTDLSHKFGEHNYHQLPAQIVINVDKSELPIHIDKVIKDDSSTLDQQHKHDDHIHIKVPFQDIINAQVSALPTFFDQILIADADGKIYYLSSPLNSGENKQLGRFQYDPFAYDFIGYQNVTEILKTIKGNEQFNKTSIPSSEEETNHSKDTTNALSQRKGLSGFSRTQSIFVGDLEFRTFIQPIRLPAEYCDSAEQAKKQWYLIGVINEDRFQRTALGAPPIVVGCAILLIVIALALLPFLRIILADRHSRIPRGLRGLVIFSLAICFSFVTLLICLLVSYHHLSDVNKRKVKDLNDTLKSQFQDELTTKLSAFELQKHIFSKNSENKFSGSCLDDLNHLSYKNYLDGNKAKLPPFYTFMVLDSQGMRSGKINSVKQLFTSRDSSLKDRIYFRKALNNDVWKVPFKNKPVSFNNGQVPVTCEGLIGETNKPADSYDFFIERIISYLDGRRETIISSGLDEERVAVMDVRFDTFFRRILPLHYSFAVVESNTGNVLYHSTPERALVENFIDETDGDSALMAKFYHQNEGLIELTYQSQPIQAYVSPLLIDENKQVLWQLITYKVLDLDENRLLISTLTVACFILAVFVCIFIGFKVISSAIQSISSFPSALCGNKVVNIRYVLIMLFMLVIMMTVISYCKVFHFFEASTVQYGNEYLEKEWVYRKAGFKKIHKFLDWDNKIKGEKLKDDFIIKMTDMYGPSNQGFSILSVSNKIEQSKQVEKFRSDCESNNICFMSVVHERDKNTWMISGLNSYGRFSSTLLEDSSLNLLNTLQKDLVSKIKLGLYNSHLADKLKKELKVNLAQKTSDFNSMTSILAPIQASDLNTPSKEDLSQGLQYKLPVFSYSTGVLVENLKNTGLSSSTVLKVFFWFVWIIFIVIIIVIIRNAVNKVVSHLFDGIDLQTKSKTDGASPVNSETTLLSPIKIEKLLQELFNSATGSSIEVKDSYDITTSSTYAKNVILLSISPEELLEKTKEIREKINEKAQAVVVDTMDSLMLCHNYYPEGSVVFITDFASLLIHKESSQKLLVLLEAYTALQLQIVIVSNIVPGYWLKVLEQRDAQGTLNDTGIDADIYRWSVLLEKFNVISICDSEEEKEVSVGKITNSKYIKYHNQWALCSFEEQSVLTSLADKDLVNLHNSEAIQSLIYKGMIDYNPELSCQQQLEIKDSALVDFIHDHFHKASIDAWRNQGSGQAWNAVLPVFLVIIALTALFLVRTGTDALQYSLSVLAGLVAAIPALSTILGHFKK